MNQVVLIGRLTKDPELRYTPGNNTAVARFSIAVDRPYAKEKTTDFFNIVVWGKAAENCDRYTSKGKLVGINGSIQNNNYEDKNGVKRYTNEIVASRVEFLEWNNRDSRADVDGSTDDFQSVEDDDLPF